MLHKIKLSYLLISGSILLLILLALSFAFISMNSIRYIEKSSLVVNREDILENSVFFLEDIISNFAGEFSGYFSGVEDITTVLSRQIQSDIDSDLILTETPIKKIGMNYYSNLQLFVSKSNTGTAFYHWGSKMIKDEHPKLGSSFIRLEPFLKGAMEANPDFYDIWLVGNDFAYIYPKDDFYKYAKNLNDVKNYFSLHGHNRNINPNKINDSNPIWLMPYIDLHGSFCLSVFNPIYNKQGEFKGGLGIDLNLKNILKTVTTRNLLTGSKTGIIESDSKDNKRLEGFLFIIDKQGRIILFPKEGVGTFDLNKEYDIYHNKNRSTNGYLIKSENENVRKLAYDMIANGSGVDEISINNINYLVSYSEIESPNWVIGFVIPVEVMMGSLKKTESKLSEIKEKMIHNIFYISLCFLILVIPIMILFFKLFFLTPLSNIHKGISKIGEGNFDLKLNEPEAIELANLSAGFNSLGYKLKKYMANLKKETQARLAVETEIEIASEMQETLLSKIKTKFIRDEFDLFVKLEPAKNVAGDFYDYFYIDENRLAILIADVSGKGLQAAFFMAMSKILIKSNCLKKPESPAFILQETNKVLCLDNEAQMFVTIFLGFYDIKTGELVYANGGHHDAMICSKEGQIDKFGVLNDIALGCFSGASYRNNNKKLKEGDTLILYTDGIIEAVSPDDKEYGIERLEKIVKDNNDASLECLCQRITENVKEFEAGNQFDDITLVVLRRA